MRFTVEIGTCGYGWSRAVLAIARNELLWWQGPQHVKAEEIVQTLPVHAWHRLSAGAGTQGERLYDWALVPLWRLQLTQQERRFGHYLVGATQPG